MTMTKTVYENGIGELTVDELEKATGGGSPNGRVEESWTPQSYSSGSDLSGGLTGSNVSNSKIEKHRP